MRRNPAIRTRGLRIETCRIGSQAQVKHTPLRLQLPKFSGFSTAANKGLGNPGKHATRVLRRSDQIRIGRRSCAHVAAACSGILTLLSIFVGLKVSAAICGSSVGPTTVPTLQMVNRTGKGDQLPLLPVIGPKTGVHLLEDYAKRTPLPSHRLMDGCEPPVSVLGHSPLAQIAGRCVS
jgi:hypothetical protein